jgi:hypothetical protein
MKNLLTAALLAALVFSVGCGEAEDAANGPESANEDSESEEATEETRETTDERPELICVAEKLNVYSEPGTTSRVVGEISRGETVSLIDDDYHEYVPDDPSGYIDWWNVKLDEGTEGWVARMFVVDYGGYMELEEVDRAAKTGTSANTEEAIKALIEGTDEAEYFFEGEYSRSPTGKMFAISSEVGDVFDYRGFMITVGYGVSSHAPLKKYGELGQWMYDGRYWSNPSVGNFGIYDCNAMNAVIVADMWWASHEYSEESEVILWEGLIGFDEIEYPLVGGPVTKPDIPDLDAEYYDDYIRCLEVYDLTTGVHYLAAAPDLSTWPKEKNWSGNGYIYEAVWKPTEKFAANPLFGPVSETEIYKNNVGVLRRFDPSQE